MKVILFKPDHYDIAELSGEDIEEFSQWNVRQLAASAIAGTFITDGRIVAFGGFSVMADDVKTGLAWLIPTVYTKKYMVSTVKALKQYVKEIPDSLDFRRILTTGHDTQLSPRWLNYMGFTKISDEPIIYERVL